MRSIRTCAVLPTLAVVMLALLGPGCDRKSESAKAPTSGASASKDHDHKAGDTHDHVGGDNHDHGDGHDHGATTELGEQTAGGFTIKASRDGDITPGKDAPIDVRVTGGTARIAAVRFWIGTQDGKGSVKAKAELDKDSWHTHAEIPSPLPTGSKLWVEVETASGDTHIAGFDLKL